MQPQLQSGYGFGDSKNFDVAVTIAVADPNLKPCCQVASMELHILLCIQHRIHEPVSVAPMLTYKSLSINVTAIYILICHLICNLQADTWY